MQDYSKPVIDENGNHLKMLEVGLYTCIRVVKKARAFNKLGYTVYGMGNKDVYGADDFATYSVWHNEKQFKECIRNYLNLGVKIVSWNNEPDQPASWIRQVINEMGMQDKVKLVCDLHDLDLIRRKLIPLPERELFLAADGLIYVSLPIQEIANRIHQVRVPNTCLYSYCNDGIVEYEDKDIPNRKALIYEGGANPPDDVELNNVFPYRSIYHIMKRFVEMGNEVHMFCGNFSAFETYQHIGCILYPPTHYDEMMKSLIKFKYGLIVFNNENHTEDQVNLTLTNKMHEYLQAGIPSLACWCQETEKYVQKHNIGFTFNHINEIGNTKQLDDKYNEVVQNIRIKRKELVMENFIVRLENMYAKLLGLEEKGIPDNIKQLHQFEYGVAQI